MTLAALLLLAWLALFAAALALVKFCLKPL